MDESYTVEAFAKAYTRRGYGSDKTAARWMAENGMTVAVEADFERCYHDMENQMIAPHGRKWTAMTAAGQNESSPQRMKNSRGKSFAAIMLKEQNANDRIERIAKERHAKKED